VAPGVVVTVSLQHYAMYFVSAGAKLHNPWLQCLCLPPVWLPVPAAATDVAWEGTTAGPIRTVPVTRWISGELGL
jgi:hypothetical protein